MQFLIWKKNKKKKEIIFEFILIFKILFKVK